MNVIEQETDSAVAAMAENITHLIDETFAGLIARRDSQYAAGIAALDAEKESLTQEHADIAEAARKQELLLSARARVAQAEADTLLLAGKVAAAEAKLQKVREAEDAPAAMRQRQEEISRRITALEEQKRNVARRVFETHYAECQTVHRALETAHFVTFLDGIRDSFLDFEARTCPARSAQDQMVRQAHMLDLTADEHTVEWVRASHWYTRRR